VRKAYLMGNTDNNFDLSNQVVQPITEQQAGIQENKDNAFWLIDSCRDKDASIDIIKNIRNQFKPNVYLRPIVAIVNQNNENIFGVDAVVTASKLNEEIINNLISRFEPINQWIDKAVRHSNVQDSGYVFKILRLIVSREFEFVPETSPQKLLGYTYPLLDLVERQDDNSLFKVLDLLESQSLISGRFITKAHFCCHCECAFLNFKEVCPQCNSDHLNSDELIHHFKCSHVAEASEYEQEGEMVCPKCDRKLKHIGVDYDKPSIVHHCNECNNRFQEATILTQCFNCGRNTEPENQIVRSIKAYKSTAIGSNAAIYGMDSLFSKILQPKFNLFSTKDFRQLLLIEKERIGRYKISTSSLVFIQFDIEKIYISLGANAHELFTELSEIFKSILRSSDVISSQNESLFILLLVETSTQQATVALSRFEQGIGDLLTHNLGYQLDFLSHIEQVSQETELDQSIDEFLKPNVS